METRRIGIVIGSVCTVLAIVGLTVNAGAAGGRGAQPGHNPNPLNVFVVNDEAAPVATTQVPPVRFQELLTAVSDGNVECDTVENVEGKRKVVEQVVFEVETPEALTGPNVFLQVSGQNDFLRITVDLVQRTDDTNPVVNLWGGRFEGPFLATGQPGEEGRFLGVCVRNNAVVRAFAVGIVEDLPPQ